MFLEKAWLNLTELERRLVNKKYKNFSEFLKDFTELTSNPLGVFVDFDSISSEERKGRSEEATLYFDARMEWYKRGCEEVALIEKAEREK